MKSKPEIKKVKKVKVKKAKVKKLKRGKAKHPRTNKHAREYEPTLPSDKRFTLAEKLLLGEELAQYSFGAAGSFQVFI